MINAQGHPRGSGTGIPLEPRGIPRVATGLISKGPRGITAGIPELLRYRGGLGESAGGESQM